MELQNRDTIPDEIDSDPEFIARNETELNMIQVMMLKMKKLIKDEMRPIIESLRQHEGRIENVERQCQDCQRDVMPDIKKMLPEIKEMLNEKRKIARWLMRYGIIAGIVIGVMIARSFDSGELTAMIKAVLGGLL